MVIYIQKLAWNIQNTKHIKKHGVIQDEVLEVLKNYHIVKRARNSRIIVIGETDTGRVLEVILMFKKKGVYFPITAYEPFDEMLKLYKNMKGDQYENY